LHWLVTVFERLISLKLRICHDCRGVCGCVLPWLREPRQLLFTRSQIGQ